MKADCQTPGKHPSVRGWNGWTEPPSADRVRRWWGTWPTANVGVATGAAAGLFMLGPDGDAGLSALAELERQQGALPPGPRSRSGGGGAHLLFAWPYDGLPVPNRKNHHGLPIDVRGEGGLFVAPPSSHPSGCRYAWDTPLPEAPSWLLDWVRRDGQLEREGSANGSPSSMGYPLFHGVASGPASRDVLRRATAYLAKCPPAISGQEGHNQTFAIARAVVWGFGLGPEAGFALLREHYNPRCRPPWSEPELWHKCTDAQNKPFEYPRGYLLDHSSPSTNGTTPPPHPNGAWRTELQRPREDAMLHAGAPPVCRVVPEYTPFPVGALPAALKRFVAEGADALDCDPVFVVLPALAVAAGLVGTARRVRLKRTWREPAVLWAVVVAEPSTQKSPAFELARQPLLGIQDQFDRDHAARLAAHEQQLTEWQQAEASERGPKPEPPPRREAFVTDTTVERLAEILHANPRGVLIARDELATWFQSLTRYRGQGNSDAPHWLELWQAGVLKIHRKHAEPRDLFVKNAVCSLIGTIQPGTLARALSSDLFDAGAPFRLLFALPPLRPKAWREVELSEDTEAAWQHVCEQLAGLPGEHVLALRAEAKQRWIAFYNRNARRQYDAAGPMRAALGKIEAYAARLALGHYLIDCASASDDPGTGPVPLGSMAAGIALAD